MARGRSARGVSVLRRSGGGACCGAVNRLDHAGRLGACDRYLPRLRQATCHRGSGVSGPASCCARPVRDRGSPRPCVVRTPLAGIRTQPFELSALAIARAMQPATDLILPAVWPVIDPASLSLWLGAVAAVAHEHPAHLDDDLGALAETSLALWPGRGRAWQGEGVEAWMRGALSSEVRAGSPRPARPARSIGRDLYGGHAGMRRSGGHLSYVPDNEPSFDGIGPVVYDASGPIVDVDRRDGPQGNAWRAVRTRHLRASCLPTSSLPMKNANNATPKAAPAAALRGCTIRSSMITCG